MKLALVEIDRIENQNVPHLWQICVLKVSVRRKNLPAGEVSAGRRVRGVGVYSTLTMSFSVMGLRFMI